MENASSPPSFLTPSLPTRYTRLRKGYGGHGKRCEGNEPESEAGVSRAVGCETGVEMKMAVEVQIAILHSVKTERSRLHHRQ